MLGLLNNEKLIVGYDLGADYSQISYCMADGEAETISHVAGAESYNIPTLLYKREGTNQWFCGREAKRQGQENGVLVENLLQLALDGETVQIDKETYDPVALLTLFVKKSLGMLSQVSSPERIDALMITCEQLNHRMLEVLTQVVAGLNLKLSKICFQSHAESFYYYMLRQPKELWESRVLLCDYRANRVQIYQMECNRRTTPIVVYINSEEHPFTAYEPMPEEEQLQREKWNRLDRELLALTTRVCGSNRISSVYLIGEHYSDEWLKESLRYLCGGRRVFMGSNLYSKGACYAMQERLCPGEEGKNYVFLGSDKLKANIGMKILRRGEESYYALLDAGINWFEAEQTMECYLLKGNTIELTVMPLIGKNARNVRIVLDDFPEGLSRLRLHLFLQEENRLIVEITDLGLGSIREAVGKTWREEIGLYEK